MAHSSAIKKAIVAQQSEIKRGSWRCDKLEARYAITGVAAAKLQIESTCKVMECNRARAMPSRHCPIASLSKRIS